MYTLMKLFFFRNPQRRFPRVYHS